MEKLIERLNVEEDVRRHSHARCVDVSNRDTQVKRYNCHEQFKPYYPRHPQKPDDRRS